MDEFGDVCVDEWVVVFDFDVYVFEQVVGYVVVGLVCVEWYQCMVVCVVVGQVDECDGSLFVGYDKVVVGVFQLCNLCVEFNGGWCVIEVVGIVVLCMVLVVDDLCCVVEQYG